MATLLGQRTPAQAVVLESAARTASTSGEFAAGVEQVGIEMRIDASASAATPSVVFTIQAFDIAANEWFDILASAAVTGAGTTTLIVDPRIAASANAVAQRGLKPRMRVNAVAGDADSLTYSVTVFGYA